MKKIAIDKANFEELIKGDYIYVDKTEFLHKILTSGTYYFLSRPRRFGKSITVNTLRAIFEGKKELFNDLYIGKTDWKWEEYPIIYLDFNRNPNNSKEMMAESIKGILLEIATKEEITIEKNMTETIFYELVEKLSKKYGKGVVFLVDEYDKPIISHIGLGAERLEIAKENRQFMKNFYDNLKPLEMYLKTVFITGVSKFTPSFILPLEKGETQWGIINNLIELDFHPMYCDMVGYREDELYKYFDEHFEAFANKYGKTKEEIYSNFKSMYNGFRFTSNEVKVYNPFSIGRALSYMEMNNYWFESGTPTFLINLIREKNYNVVELEGKRIGKEEIRAYDIENLKLIPLLFQTGYLTIKKIEGGKVYTVGFPNNEVEEGFCNNLITSFTDDNIGTPLIYDMKEAFAKEDYELYFELMKEVFESIPYTIIPKELSQRESYYHTIFYLVTTLMGDYSYKIETEIITAKGRIDMAVETENKMFIIEFKCNQSVDTAIEQINNKKYAEKYKNRGKEIVLLGINFSTDKKNIEEWKMLEYQ